MIYRPIWRGVRRNYFIHSLLDFCEAPSGLALVRFRLGIGVIVRLKPLADRLEAWLIRLLFHLINQDQQLWRLKAWLR